MCADGWIVFGLLALLVVIYNANGREIGSVDSQPNKLAARELLIRHTLTLNHPVGAVPALAERPAFVLSKDGQYRSAYSPVPAVLAAAIAWPLTRVGLLNPRAALAANVIAVLGASVLTAIAVGFAYLTARRALRWPGALAVALGLGLGTGYWNTVSRTLWVHETAILGMAIAVYAFASSDDQMRTRAALVVGAGLALAGAARPQLAPVIAVLLLGTFLRSSRAGALGAIALVVVAAGLLMALYLRWFGHPLGPVSTMTDVNNAVHWTRSAFAVSLDGPAGLLVSPNRGLLIYSPVVLVAVGGLRAVIAEDWRGPLRWCTLGAVVQFLFYGSFTVWWAGHTYGPRYLLDILPLIVPLAAAALARTKMRSFAAGVATVALTWSIIVSATGAFCYPNDQWNTDPVDVDRDHARLWSWSDTQIARCWHAGPSPQNFRLFQRQTFLTPLP